MRLLPALLLLIAAPAVQAQSDDAPWYLGASLGLTQVSNLYRLDGSQPRNDDQLRSLSLLAGGQMHLGRQRLRLDLRASKNDYQRNPDLGYVGYNATGNLDWQLGERLSGQFTVAGQRTLAPFNPGNAPSTTDKNIERNESARFSARYGLAGPWALEAGVTANQRDFSIPLYDRFDYSQVATDYGVRWQPQPAWSMRVGGRHASGRYPRFRQQADGSYLADRYKRNELELQLGWNPRPDHQLSLRLGQGTSRYTEAFARNSKGTNGSMDWRWAPSARWVLQLQASRDSGDDTRLVDLGQFGRFDSVNSSSTDALQLRASYAISAKLSLDLNAGEYRRKLVDSLGDTRVSGTDRTRSAGLGLRWAFTRQGQAGCQVNRDSRTGATGFSLPYTASSYGCSVQYLIGG